MRRVVPIVFILAVCAGVSCSKGSSTVACADPTQATTVDLQDFAYSPVCTAAAAGATLTLTNTGAQPHSFTVKGTGVNVMVGAGQRSDAALAGIDPGTYQVVCTLHPQMVGALKIG